MLTYPNPMLQQVSEPVSGLVDANLVDRLREAMSEWGEGALGLAAVQIGVLQRVFVTQLESVRVFVNPVIEGRSISTETHGEGCMSVPGVFLPVRRSVWIKMGYYDLSGARRDRIFIGLEGRVIQHEYDHLNGVLLGGQL